MPLILGAQSAVATGFDVDNSCRFNDDDTAYLTRAQGTPTGSGLKATVSVWFKPSYINPTTNSSGLFEVRDAGNTISFDIGFDNGDMFAGILQSGWIGYLVPNMLFRDRSAWYHICFVYDSAQANDYDRMVIYINGKNIRTDLGGYSTETYISQSTASTALAASSGYNQQWGRYAMTGASVLDGYLAECVFIDGEAYAPSDFGEYDSDSPTIWKPKDVSGLTFGDQGCYLAFGDSAALGDDTSGNTNDYTATNITASDQATDTPTNNFSTFNPLNIPITAAPTFSEGNCEVVSQVGAGLNFGGTSTICVSAGKWYWECSPVSVSNSSVIGVTGRPATDAYLNDPPGHDSDSYGYVNNGEKLTSNSGSSYGDTYTDGDIIGVALDITNLKIYFAKNGVWQDSGDPTSGASGTGAAFTITAPALATEGIYAFSAADYANGATTFQANWGGCPAFTVSSAAADENGYGAFEYAPPSGYLAVCTKNLGSDGG